MSPACLHEGMQAKRNLDSRVRDTLKRSHDNLLHLLETELSIVRVFTDVAVTHYSRSDRHKGDNARQAAEKGLAAIRHFAGSSDALDEATKESMQRQCDELQGALSNLAAAGPGREASRLKKP